MNDPVERFARDVVAVGQEWEVSPRTTGVVMALMLLAMEAGIRDPDEALAWNVAQGHVVRNESAPSDSPDAFEITPEGERCARLRLGLPADG